MPLGYYERMSFEAKELCYFDKRLYQCISKDIDTERVVLTSKQILHIAEKHPEAYYDVLIELKDAILEPDYILRDKKHDNTGLVIKRIALAQGAAEHAFIVLRICTDSENGKLANSIISGWKISDKRLERYLRSHELLYKNERF